MIKRRQRQQQAVPCRMDPGEVKEGVTLPVKIANAGLLLLGCIRDLVVIGAQGADQAQLVGRRGIENE